MIPARRQSRRNYRGCRVAVAALALAVQPAVTTAQDRAGLQIYAKAMAASIRTAGEPKDRCSTGAQVGEGGVVTRRLAATVLLQGDKVMSINRHDLSTKGPDDIVAVLRTIEPTATVPVTVQREGKLVTVQLACSNSRPAYEVMLTGLDQAAAGKFDACVETLGQRDDLVSGVAVIRSQCAWLSRNANGRAAGQITYDALRMMIDDAAWSAPSRAAVVDSLRNSEGLIDQSLGPAKFQELVALTRAWPNGERMFADAAPDWALFRRNAEAALSLKLVDPDSARFTWPFGFTYGTWKPLLDKRIEGYWTCGLLNARNRMGGYTGSTSFVVVLDRSGSVRFADMGSSGDYDVLSIQCSKSLKLLPPPPPELAGGATPGPAAPAASLADELRKLVELRNSGALSEAEFELAKKKLLGPPG